MAKELTEEQAKKEQIIRQSKRTQIYQAVFDTEDGRWVLQDLAKRYRLMKHAPVANDRISTDYLNGQRSVVADIHETLTRDIAKILARLEQLPKELYE